MGGTDGWKLKRRKDSNGETGSPAPSPPSPLRSRSVSAKVERPLASAEDGNNGFRLARRRKKEIEDAKQKSSLVNLIWFLLLLRRSSGIFFFVFLWFCGLRVCCEAGRGRGHLDGRGKSRGGW